MPPALHKILEASRVKRVQKGQVLVYAGDHTPEVFVIREGVVKLYNIDDQGNEKILHLLQSPMVVPLSFFSRPDATPRWFYTALTDCDLYIVSQEKLKEIMESDSLTMHFLINKFSEEVHEVLTRLESLGKSDSNTKLVSALRYLAVCHGVKGRGGWCKIPFPVNHQLLADMTGVSRETVSLAMKTLSDNGMTRNPRLARLEINLERLQKTYGGPEVAADS